MVKKKSWTREVLEIIAAFIFAWVANQLLAFATGTPLPIVSVVSDSMYHTDHFEDWWSRNEQFYNGFGINKADFTKFPAPNGLSRGDLLFVIRPNNLTAGDVVIYNRPDGLTVVHRIVEVQRNGLITKGDNNRGPDQPISEKSVQGEMLFAVPVLGYPRFVLHLVGI